MSEPGRQGRRDFFRKVERKTRQRERALERRERREGGDVACTSEQRGVAAIASPRPQVTAIAMVSSNLEKML